MELRRTGLFKLHRKMRKSGNNQISNLIFGKFVRPLGADSAGFLARCFGGRFSQSQSKGLTGGMVFKRRGETITDSHYNWSPRIEFSLISNLSQQSHHSWLSRVSNPVLTSIIERLTVFRADSTTISPVIEKLRESSEIFNTIEKHLRVFFNLKREKEMFPAIALAAPTKAGFSSDPARFTPPAVAGFYRRNDEGSLRAEVSRSIPTPRFNGREATEIGLWRRFEVLVMALDSSSS